MRGVVFRIPRDDYKEIKVIADRLGTNMKSAYNIWKRKKGILGNGKLWEEF